MDTEQLKSIILQKNGASLEFPFGPEVMVFKVMGKMFALLAWAETPLRLSLKCEPDHALVLRSVYEAVTPGYHLSKVHWNTITLDGSIPWPEIDQWIEDSYHLVVATLKKAQKQALLALADNRHQETLE